MMIFHNYVIIYRRVYQLWKDEKNNQPDRFFIATTCKHTSIIIWCLIFSNTSLGFIKFHPLGCQDDPHLLPGSHWAESPWWCEWWHDATIAGGADEGRCGCTVVHPTVHGGLVAKVVQCCKMINIKGLEIFGDVIFRTSNRCHSESIETWKIEIVIASP